MATSDNGGLIVIDQRKERRFPLRLRVAIVYHLHRDAANRPTFHGTSCDLSLTGVAVILDRNISNPEEVTVLLSIPPEHDQERHRIVEATAKIVYTVFSSKDDAFRVGLEFRNFKGNSKRLLHETLERRSFVLK